VERPTVTRERDDQLSKLPVRMKSAAKPIVDLYLLCKRSGFFGLEKRRGLKRKPFQDIFCDCLITSGSDHVGFWQIIYERFSRGGALPFYV